MSGEQTPQLQWLQIDACIPELIVETTIEQEGNFELTLQTYVVHVKLSSGNGQATVVQISVGDCVSNP